MFPPVNSQEKCRIIYADTYKGPNSIDKKRCGLRKLACAFGRPCLLGRRCRWGEPQRPKAGFGELSRAAASRRSPHGALHPEAFRPPICVLQPICQTSGYLHREYGFVNFAERLGIGSKLATTPPMVCLEDVVRFCDHVRDKNLRLEVGVCLQGLAGLQLQEATRLTWNKVDLENGLVEISGEVKNEYRNRVIPVCQRVLEALRRVFEARPRGKVQIVAESVLVSSKGFCYGNAWHNYSKEVSAAIREWNLNLDWKPKDPRNCLPTFAVMTEMQSDVWEQYIGHAPHSVTARHYIPRLAALSEGEENALKRPMAVFCFHVTSQVDRVIQIIQAGKILNFFEPQDPSQRMSSKPPENEKAANL